MFRYLPLVLKNCWRNRRRTFLTIASIGISMCLLGVMIAMYHAFYLSDPTPEQALRLVTRNRISLHRLHSANPTRARSSRCPACARSWWPTGSAAPTRTTRPQELLRPLRRGARKAVHASTRNISIPEDQRKAFERDRTACVVGRDLANKFHFKMGDRIHITGDIFPGDYEFTVRGIFDSPRASEIMYFNSEYLEQTLPEAPPRQRGHVLHPDRQPGPLRAHRQSHRRRVRQFHRADQDGNRPGVRGGFLALLGNVKMFLIAISAAVMFTVLLVSANTMAMSVRERVREVGVLKTLGFTPGNILGMILGEACAISLAGGTIGLPALHAADAAS